MGQTHEIIRPQPGILDIAPYQGGESRLQGHARVLKLSSNENPYGPSPRALGAFRRTADRLALYPDAAHAGLREAIGDVHGLDPARVICGAGSDELLALLAQTYAGPGDEVIHTAHGFGMYRIVALANGARPVEVAEGERRVDVDRILAAAGPHTRLVFVANPANPTGTLLTGTELRRLADGLPETAILVLDGAYAEYVREPGFDAGQALALSRPNVVMTRTFSKIHGLAGLRVGWAAAAPAIIDALNRVRGPFNLSIPALETAAAAVRDREWTETCAARNEAWRVWLAEALRRSGLPSDESHANFLLARFGSAEEALACDAHLREAGIIVRRVAGYGFPEALRITVGAEEACRRVAETIAAFRAAR